MSGPPDDLDALRAAFAARAPQSPPDGCPSAEQLWSAVAGTSPPAETRALVAHTAGCAVCAAAWRLARELNPAPARRRALPRAWMMAAAAALALATGAALWMRPASRPPEYRDPSASDLAALSPEGQPVGRCRLRWSPGPAGARYDVWITTEALAPVFTQSGLNEPEVLVPESTLRPFPRGTRLRWRVEMHTEAGTLVRSRAFTLRLE